MGHYSDSPCAGDFLPNGQSKITVVKKHKTFNTLHTLSIQLFACAPNLKLCRSVLRSEKFLSFMVSFTLRAKMYTAGISKKLCLS